MPIGDVLRYMHTQCKEILDKIANNELIDIHMIESKRCICDLARVLCESHLNQMFKNSSILT